MEFSVADRVNVEITGSLSDKCIAFLDKIYGQFSPPVNSPQFSISVGVTDQVPIIEKEISLGKDGYYDKNTLVLSSGHFFIRRDGNTLEVGIPSRVKRGRIPFKRRTPGRHISDEIIEPLLNLILQKIGCTFLHASAVFEKGAVTVLMGWRGTGKTNAILREFESKEIWSDDLAILDSEGYVYPYLRPIRLYSYNLELLNPEYLKEHRLKFRRYLTPPWRPVHYLPLLDKSSKGRAPLKELIFLNNPDSGSLAEDAERIMLFEQSFFQEYKLMLDQSGVFKSKTRTRDVVENALKSTAYKNE
jgi:hypothetical protein